MIVLGVSKVVLVVKNPPFSAGDRGHEFDYSVWKIPWRRAWQPIQYSCLVGKRNLVGYSPRGHTELDTTEVT